MNSSDESKQKQKIRQDYLWLLDQALEINEHLREEKQVMGQCEYIQQQMNVRRQQLLLEAKSLKEQQKFDQYDLNMVKASFCEQPLNLLFSTLFELPPQARRTSVIKIQDVFQNKRSNYLDFAYLEHYKIAPVDDENNEQLIDREKRQTK